ncbi:carbohydrate-binding domain-containing protein [Candidatus Saccharibacteria bacterium]|nr:carbohydrate-binding domain-containing protein [Candidatus Saccharibacteria bacterium]
MADVRTRPRPDLRWLIVVIILVPLVIAAVIINNNYPAEDSTKLANALDIDNGDLKINWGQYPTYDINLTEPLTITQSGTYQLTGTLIDGNIKVQAPNGEVKLVLNDVTIVSPDGPAIIINDADETVIELAGENNLSDSSKYSEEYNEDITGAIYSKSDLTFQGEGTLALTGNYQDAIVGKDDVKFNSGTYVLDANDDAIRGKDSVYIVNGNFIINSSADCIKSTNDIDTGKGFVLIENGNFNLTSEAAKAIKSVKTVLIQGGNYSISSYDDAIHSDIYVGITNGQINLTSGDDGIHANRELIIDGGDIHIAKAYEGLEAQVVTINDGDISLITNDDGINAGGGADESSKNRPGANPFDADENCILTINGGNVYINSTGDGVDSNGWLYFNGGSTIVDGPTNNGNGALDSGMGIVMNGGEVLAIGSSGMAGNLGSTSNVLNISIFLTAIQPANTNLKIKDSAGNIIIEHDSSKQFSHLAFGSPKLQFGETYILYLNDEEYTSFTISGITTTVGKERNNFSR